MLLSLIPLESQDIAKEKLPHKPGNWFSISSIVFIILRLDKKIRVPYDLKAETQIPLVSTIDTHKDNPLVVQQFSVQLLKVFGPKS